MEWDPHDFNSEVWMVCVMCPLKKKFWMLIDDLFLLLHCPYLCWFSCILWFFKLLLLLLLLFIAELFYLDCLVTRAKRNFITGYNVSLGPFPSPVIYLICEFGSWVPFLTQAPGMMHPLHLHLRAPVLATLSICFSGGKLVHILLFEYIWNMTLHIIPIPKCSP